MKKINWDKDKATEAIKYGSRAKADFMGYFPYVHCVDATKANKANDEFQKSIDDWKEENANEEEN